MEEELKNQTNETAETQTPTVEELMAQLAEEKARNIKNKTALDKALKEVGDTKKALRAKQTAEEQEVEAKREAEEAHKAYVAELERKIALQEAKERYMSLGMDVELATSSATAELDGDKITVTENYKKFSENQIKVAQAEWMRTRPEANAGNGDGEAEDPFIKGFKY